MRSIEPKRVFEHLVLEVRGLRLLRDSYFFTFWAVYFIDYSPVFQLLHTRANSVVLGYRAGQEHRLGCNVCRIASILTI